MSMSNACSLALLRFHGYRGGGHAGTELILLLVGVAFAGVIVWAIQRSGRPTIYR